MTQFFRLPDWAANIRLDRHGGLIALALILLFNIAVTPNFLQPQTLAVNISQVATIAIVAMGMTMVIATGGIDLSVGAVMALSAHSLSVIASPCPPTPPTT